VERRCRQSLQGHLKIPPFLQAWRFSLLTPLLPPLFPPLSTVFPSPEASSLVVLHVLVLGFNSLAQALTLTLTLAQATHVHPTPHHWNPTPTPAPSSPRRPISPTLTHILTPIFTAQAAHIAHRQPVRTDILTGHPRAPLAATALFALQSLAAATLAAVWRHHSKVALGVARLQPPPGGTPALPRHLLAVLLLCSSAALGALSPWGPIAAYDLELGHGATWGQVGMGAPRALAYSAGVGWYLGLQGLGLLGLAGVKAARPAWQGAAAPGLEEELQL
jgi:hypothetical protein